MVIIAMMLFLDDLNWCTCHVSCHVSCSDKELLQIEIILYVNEINKVVVFDID